MTSIIKFQIPRHDEDPSEALIDFLAEMDLDWDGDESGVTLTTKYGATMLGSPGDYIVKRGDYIVKRGDEYLIVFADHMAEVEENWRLFDEGKREFKYRDIDDAVSSTLFFKDGDLERVEIKHQDEVLIMSSGMFFALFIDHAHKLYDKAAEQAQNIGVAE